MSAEVKKDDDYRGTTKVSFEVNQPDSFLGTGDSHEALDEGLGYSQGSDGPKESRDERRPERHSDEWVWVHAAKKAGVHLSLSFDIVLETVKCKT